MQRLLRCSRSFKVTNFSTNRKLIYDFLILTYLLSCTVSKLWLIICYIFASERECLNLTLSRGWSSANIATNDVSLKTRFFAYICAAESIGVSSTTFTQSVRKATEFGEITRRLRLLRCLRSFKVTEFGSNRKLHFLLVISSYLAPILHRCRDSQRSLYSATPLLFNSPDGGVLLGRSP